MKRTDWLTLIIAFQILFSFNRLSHQWSLGCNHVYGFSLKLCFPWFNSIQTKKCVSNQFLNDLKWSVKDLKMNKSLSNLEFGLIYETPMLSFEQNLSLLMSWKINETKEVSGMISHCYSTLFQGDVWKWISESEFLLFDKLKWK